jgi:phosphoglycolate phosphatase-like HAD superfamily hydrolase
MVDMAAFALILDLDGTVWDSAAWFAAALGGDDEAAVKAAESDLIIGGNIIAALRNAGMTRNRLLRDAMRRGGPPPLFAGMGETLTALARSGTQLGIATSLPGTLALPMLESVSIGSLFGAVVHAGLCRTPKPHPHPLLMTARMLGVDPAAGVFYVGDRAVDAEAARRAGMGFVWMAHGYERPAYCSGVATNEPADLLGL